MDKFVIIDGNNLMFRAFYALPQMTNFNGEHCNAVFGFTNMLIKLIKEISPKYLAVTFDVAKKNFRHEKFQEYKGTRKPTPPELVTQFPIIKELLGKMNISVVEQEGLEADDLMGCLSRMFNTDNIIVSADRDAFQLINKNTQIRFPKKGISETIILNNDNLKEFYGVNPEQVVDLKSLMGDSSDNIPGVSGIGEKKALQLIEEYKSLDGVYNNIDKLSGKLKENLVNDKEKAYMSHYLAQIVTDIKLDYALKDFEYTFPFGEEVRDMFRRYQFESMLKKDELFGNTHHEKLELEHIVIDNEKDLNELANRLSSASEFAIYVDSDNFDIYFQSEFKINFSKDLLSMGVNLNRVCEILKPVFENDKIRKIVFDSKALKHYFYQMGINLKGVSFDCVLARYLINSLAKANPDLSIIISECGLDDEKSAFALKKIKEIYYSKLEKLNLIDLYYKIEMPLVDVLFDMEIVGFRIDKSELSQLEIKYREEIVVLEKSIYEYCGKKFNLSSPKQLAEVLFDEMNLNVPSNKKKSTSIEVLQEIENKHPVISLIIRWRAISKLYSTYVVGFENIVGTDGKIHTIFNQALTSTGRLSSSEPNLQNIPVRTEEGRILRKVFIPNHPEGQICSADYSQIELRLLANFSGDKNMINAFNSGEDIHRRTASEIFGMPIDMVDDIKRREAKAINFGIVYGISDFGLSQNIGSTRKEASNYIKQYFARYPKIEEYINGNVEIARKDGAIRTMFGRMRLIPEINSTNHNLRNFGERVAMNMPLQGSASDIIKLAMINIYNQFNLNNLKSKIIVQVHDELVVDVYPGELDKVKEILKTGMEGVVDMQVPLIVNIESGDTWYEAK